MDSIVLTVKAKKKKNYGNWPAQFKRPYGVKNVHLVGGAISANQESSEQYFQYLLSVMRKSRFSIMRLLVLQGCWQMNLYNANGCGSQEPKPIFLLGAGVQYSPVQCSWQLYRTTTNNESLVYIYARFVLKNTGDVFPKGVCLIISDSCVPPTDYS